MMVDIHGMIHGQQGVFSKGTKTYMRQLGKLFTILVDLPKHIALWFFYYIYGYPSRSAMRALWETFPVTD